MISVIYSDNPSNVDEIYASFVVCVANPTNKAKKNNQFKPLAFIVCLAHTFKLKVHAVLIH